MNDEWVATLAAGNGEYPPSNATCRRRVTVYRTDFDSAWAMDLRFTCGDNEIPMVRGRRRFETRSTHMS